jgi:hypothetical protein
MTVRATKESLLGKTEKSEKTTTFFNPETKTDPDQKPTFEQKTDPDPDRLSKVNPAAGLYYILTLLHL